MREWTRRELDFVISVLEKPTKSIFIDFCGEYGDIRTYDSVQKKVKALREEQLEASEEVDLEEVDLSFADDLTIPGVSNLVKQERKDITRAWLQSVIDVSDEIKDRLSYGGSRNVVDSEKSTLCVLLSDTHVGKHTKRYNLETAMDRLEEIPRLLKKHPMPEIDEIVIILAGDMIEGEDIFPTQNTKIECSAIEQVQACSTALWNALVSFRELFKCPVRVETCPGNHGRVSKTANEKTNWDNVTYHILRVMNAMYDDPELIVNCNFEPFRTFKVKDKIGMAYHHGIKHTGTPAMRLKVAGWEQSRKFDFLVHGHWHEWHVGNWLGKFVMGNGCMCGPDDMAERMAVEDSARQGFFLITPGKPVHSFSFLEWTYK